MKQERFTLTASSLGSYFGVGFNSPTEQIRFDLGIDEQEFTEDAQDRMDWGTFLEEGALNYFENKLQISIGERNEKVRYAFDERIRCKTDGMAIIDGEMTVVECKISNAQEPFTQSKGYAIQVQAYMQATGATQALLCGMWKGKPIYTTIRRDDELIGLMEQMVDFVFACLNGIEDYKNFPYDLIELYNSKYNAQGVVIKEAEFSTEAEEKAYELFELKQEIKELEAREKDLSEWFKERYENVKFSGIGFSMSISEVFRKGGLDEALLTLDNPDLNLDMYRKPGTTYVNATFRKTKA